MGSIGALLLAFLTLRAEYASAHWPHQGAPYGMNTTSNKISTVTEVFVTTEIVPCNTTTISVSSSPPSTHHPILVTTKSWMSHRSSFGRNATSISPGTMPKSSHGTHFGSGTIVNSPSSHKTVHTHNTTSTRPVTKPKSSYGNSVGSTYFSTITTTIEEHYSTSSSASDVSLSSSPSSNASTSLATTMKSSHSTHFSSSVLITHTQSTHSHYITAIRTSKTPISSPTPSKTPSLTSSVTSSSIRSVTSIITPSTIPSITPSSTLTVPSNSSFSLNKSTTSSIYSTTIIVTSIQSSSPPTSIPPPPSITSSSSPSLTPASTTPSSTSPPPASITPSSTSPPPPSITLSTPSMSPSSSPSTSPLTPTSTILSPSSFIPSTPPPPSSVLPPSSNTPSPTPLTTPLTSPPPPLSIALPPSSNTPSPTLSTTPSTQPLLPPSTVPGALSSPTGSHTFETTTPSQPPPISSTTSLTEPYAISTPPSRITSITMTPPTSATTASECCFVVQDTVNYNYWADTTVSTHTFTTVSTSIISRFTRFSDTVITNVQILRSPYTSSILVTFDLAARLPTANNAGSGQTNVDSELSGAVTAVYAQTVTSPTNFFVYRTARIIFVPAVTDSNGQLTCATTSTNFPSTLSGGPQSSVTFTGINSNAEMYFEGASAGKARVVTDISLSTPYVALATADNMGSIALPTTGILTMSQFGGLNANQATEAGTNATGLDESESDYGYVSPFFIPFLEQNYAKQYPGFAGCLPGGPSIDPGNRQAGIVGPSTFENGLTDTSNTTSYASGCFDSAAKQCATAAVSIPTALPEVTPMSSPKPPQAPAAPQKPPTRVALPSLPPSPSHVALPNPPTTPAFLNPNSLSPPQLSQLASVLQVTSEPSPISPPPPTSLMTSISPAVIIGNIISSVSPTTEAVPSPNSTPPAASSPRTSVINSLSPAVTASVNPSESSPATKAVTSSSSTPPVIPSGEADARGGDQLWLLLALCLGGLTFTML